MFVNHMEIQGRISLGIKILTVSLVPLLLYLEDLLIVMNEAINSDLTTHILIIPFLVIYIIYRKRKILTALANQFTYTPFIKSSLLIIVIGSLICVLAYLIKWFGSYTFQPLEYHIASLPLFISGIIIIIFNIHIFRSLLFSIFLLIFLMPPPLEIAQSIGSALAIISSEAAYNLLKTIRLPVRLLITYGNPVIFLNTPSGTEIPFAIDIACSGLYSLIGFIIFAVFIAYIARGPIKKKIFIIFIGLPLIYTLNIIRITLIVLIGYISGPTLSLNIFHLFGGWTLIFIGTVILLMLIENVLKIQIFRLTSETCTHTNMNEDESTCMSCGKVLKTTQNKLLKTDVIKIASIIVITIILLSIKVSVFAITEGSAEVLILNPSGEQTTTKILPKIEGYQANFMYRDVDFEQISGQDASLTFLYVPETKSKPSIWVGLEIGATKSCLHPWEVCLITWRQTHDWKIRVTQLDLRDVQLLENPPLSARYFVFKSTESNITQVTLYWYTKSIFNTQEGLLQKWSKVSVIRYTEIPDEYKFIEDELLTVAIAIANYWQPIQTWSWVALAIANNSFILLIITGGLLLGSIVYYIFLERNKRIEVMNAYTRILDPDECLILNSVKSLSKELAIESKIALKYREISGRNIDIEKLHKKLIEAEEANIIERKIININDEPYITWKFIS